MNYPAHIKITNETKFVQTVEEHCAGTGNHARNILQIIGFENLGYLAGYFHDTGKCSLEFSRYLTNECKNQVIHSFAGVSFFLNNYHDSGQLLIKELTSELIAFAIGAHHGLFDIYDMHHQCGFDHRRTKQPEYDDKAIQEFFSACREAKKVEILFQAAADELQNSFSVIKDLCHNESNEELLFYIGMLARLILSAVIDGDRLDTASFMLGKNFNEKFIIADKQLWQDCLINLHKYLSKFSYQTEISIARRDLSDLCEEAATLDEHILRLNLPTGAGKTLSGLRFALKHAGLKNKKRIIFVTPLLSILDQNAKIIREAIQNDSLILEHHSNVLREDVEIDKETYELLIDTWNHPIIITTLVQLLNTLFDGNTTAIRRFHSLSNSIVIFDEIQTVPPKMLTLFNLAINFITGVCNATVVLCSATQPEFSITEHPLVDRGREIIEKQQLIRYQGAFKRTNIFDKGNMTIEEIAVFAKQLRGKYKSVLIVCNKKSQSEGLFKLLADENHIFHLSASMCMEHRRDVLEAMQQCISKEENLICVSTQVIEAGVDISFGTVIRFSAGLDNIIQSAGRCNRNGKSKDPAPVYIVSCIGESLTLLKDIKKQQDATLNLLELFQNNPENFDSTLDSEKSIGCYYHGLYHSMNQGEQDYPVKNSPSLFEMLSWNNQYSENNEKYFLRQAFKTAGKYFEVFDSRQYSVIVPYGRGCDFEVEFGSEKAKREIAYFYKLIEQAKPYCISIFDYQKKKLDEMDGIRYFFDGRIMILDQQFYAKEIGFTFQAEEDNLCDFLIL